jgi:PEP-CTERM motif
MLSIKPLGQAVAALALVATASTSHAALTTYSSSVSFADAITAAAPDDFESLTLEFIATPLLRTVGTYGYAVSAPEGLFGIAGDPDTWLGPFSSFDTMTFDTFTGGVQAIGGNFFATNLDGVFFPGQTVVVTVTDSLNATAQLSYTNSELTDFAGFTSTGTITSLTVQIAARQNEAFATANNLILAQVPTAPIPEPATYGMLLAGLGALAFVRRRRSA